MNKQTMHLSLSQVSLSLLHHGPLHPQYSPPLYVIRANSYNFHPILAPLSYSICHSNSFPALLYFIPYNSQPFYTTFIPTKSEPI